jgi:hypothetical protein
VIFFPAGTYLLSQPLYANASNIVLRGAGSNKTRLVFTRSLSQVYGVQWGVDKCTGESRLRSTNDFMSLVGDVCASDCGTCSASWPLQCKAGRLISLPCTST